MRKPTVYGLNHLPKPRMRPGLVGRFLRPLAKHLERVDLSNKMLEHAEQTGSYDALVQADLVEYLERLSEPFDLIVAADTLNYFCDLTDVMRLLIQSIRPGGYLLFTVKEGPFMGDDGYYLQPTTPWTVRSYAATHH